MKSLYWVTQQPHRAHYRTNMLAAHQRLWPQGMGYLPIGDGGDCHQSDLSTCHQSDLSVQRWRDTGGLIPAATSVK